MHIGEHLGKVIKMEIIFEEKLLKIGPLQVIKIPLNSSKKLPSRGMVMVQGTINDITFKAPLEPDGKGSHWMEVSPRLSKELGITVGETVSLNIEPLNEWTQPYIPEDILNAITKANILKQWNGITVKAKWDWIRWIRSTKNPETRNKRIDVACSKLQKGDKNPCCFDRTRCTDTDVSKSGILLDE